MAYSVSQDFKDKIKDGITPQKIALVFSDLYFTDEDIEQNGVSISETFSTDEHLSFGACPSAVLSFGVIAKSLLSGYEFGDCSAYIGVQTSTASFSMPAGTNAYVVIGANVWTATASGVFVDGARISSGKFNSLLYDGTDLYAFGSTFSLKINPSDNSFVTYLPHKFMAQKMLVPHSIAVTTSGGVITGASMWTSDTLIGYEFCPMGVYMVEKPKKTVGEVVTIQDAYDRMKLFDVDATEFLSSLTYPKTLSQIYVALCNYIGVGYVSATFPYSTVSYANSPFSDASGSCREILSWIAERARKVAKFDRTGRLDLVWVGSSVTESLTTSDIGMDDYDCSEYHTEAVTGVLLKSTSGTSLSFGSMDNPYSIMGNPFISTITNSDLADYEAIPTYIPMSLRVIEADPSVEVGDMLSVADLADAYQVLADIYGNVWSVGVGDPEFRLHAKPDETIIAHGSYAQSTESGSVATFTSVSDRPFTDVTATITPVQSGSGDPSPSNVRPITGWTGAKVIVNNGNYWNDSYFSTASDPMQLITDPESPFYGYYWGSVASWDNNYVSNPGGFFGEGHSFGRLTVSADFGCSQNASASFNFRVYFKYDDGTSGYNSNITISPGTHGRYSRTSTAGKNCIGCYISTSAGVTNVNGRIKDVIVKQYDGSDEYYAPVGNTYPVIFSFERTIMWNQLMDKSAYPATETINGVTFTNNGDGSVIANGTATSTTVYVFDTLDKALFDKTHYYLITFSDNIGSSTTFELMLMNGSTSFLNAYKNQIFLAASATNTSHAVRFVVRNGYTANNLVFRPQIFDLTQMFGAEMAGYIYGLEQKTSGAGIAYFKSIFPENYYPYDSGTEMTINMEQAVYGGEVDAMSGVLTVTHGYKLFTGADSEGWTIGTGSNSGRVIAPVPDAINTAERTAVLGNIVTDAVGSDEGTGFLYNTSFYYYYPSTMGSTVAEWKTYLASNNLQIVYPLATPISAQLTPAQINALVGTNNVWADTGDVSVTYDSAINATATGQYKQNYEALSVTSDQFELPLIERQLKYIGHCSAKYESTGERWREVDTDMNVQYNANVAPVSQMDVFNRLTNGGQDQGIYIDNGKIYINGEYIRANSINADLIYGGTLSGAEINIGNGAFTVDSTGTVGITKGELNISFSGAGTEQNKFIIGRAEIPSNGRTYTLEVAPYGVWVDEVWTSTGDTMNSSSYSASGYLLSGTSYNGGNTWWHAYLLNGVFSMQENFVTRIQMFPDLGNNTIFRLNDANGKKRIELTLSGLYIYNSDGTLKASYT